MMGWSLVSRTGQWTFLLTKKFCQLTMCYRLVTAIRIIAVELKTLSRKTSQLFRSQYSFIYFKLNVYWAILENLSIFPKVDMSCVKDALFSQFTDIVEREKQDRSVLQTQHLTQIQRVVFSRDRVIDVHCEPSQFLSLGSSLRPPALLLSHQVPPHPEGSIVIVGSDEFQSRWENLTKGCFRGLDWTHLIAAGGAVLRCLENVYSFPCLLPQYSPLLAVYQRR